MILQPKGGKPMPEEEKEKVETVVDEDEFVDVESDKLAAEREAKKAEEATPRGCCS